MTFGTGAILPSVIASLIAAPLIAAASLLYRPIRHWGTRRSQCFELRYSKPHGACKWDIQWQDLRLTIRTTAVHNDYLEAVEVLPNGKNPSQKLGNLSVAKTYSQVSGLRVGIRVNSIVRQTPQSGPAAAEYIVQLSVSRPRFGSP